MMICCGLIENLNFLSARLLLCQNSRKYWAPKMKNTTEKSLLGKIQLFDRTGGITREVCNVCLPGSSLFLFVVWDGDLFEVSEMK